MKGVVNKERKQRKDLVFPICIYMYIIKCHYFYKNSNKNKERNIRGSNKNGGDGKKKLFHRLQYQDLFSSEKIISVRRIITVSVLLRLSGF